MRSYETFDQTSQQTAKQPFVARVKALDPMVHTKMASIFVLAVLTILMASLISMNVVNASQVQQAGQTAPQGMIATKTDRVSITAAKDNCDKQAWGAWSAECAAALTGAAKVRKVSFVTVEQKPMTVNETILARFPTIN